MGYIGDDCAGDGVMSVADWCSVAGFSVGLVSLFYAVHQQRRADREMNRRKGLAAESQRFLVGLKPSITDQGVRLAINDQLERLKPSLS
jgi:hypothetical protein